MTRQRTAKDKAAKVTKKASKIAWKDFEVVVAQLEHMLSSVGAEVKHNVQLRDRFGKLRQVDAAVWIETGTTEILIIMECRRRESVSDSPWVEQVVSKRKNLRADRAIMVTNTPLTGPAQVLAKDEGIELRTLQEIDSSFRQYLSDPGYEMGSMQWIHGQALLDPRDPEKFSELQTKYEAALKANQAKVFLRVPGREDVSFDSFVAVWIKALGVPTFNDRNFGGKGVLVAKPEMNASVVFDGHEIEINSLMFLFVAKFEGVMAQETSQSIYVGAGPKDRHIHRGEFEIEGAKVTMLSSKEASKLKLSVSVELQGKEKWTQERTEVIEMTYNAMGEPTTEIIVPGILNNLKGTD